MLLGPDGLEFCSGMAECACKPVFPGSQDVRLFVQIVLGKFTFDAVVDTGGSFLVLDPEIVSGAGLDLGGGLEERKLSIRGYVWRGNLYRLAVEFLAVEGIGLQKELTVFVPTVEDGQIWPLPSFLGWHGCLERIRFAVDPVKEQFFFGDAG